MSRAKVISLLNQKGGVGKTTMTLNMSRGINRSGHKVLMVDLDTSQASLTVATIGHLQDGDKGVVDVLVAGTPVSSLVRSTSIKNLDILPSEKAYRGLNVPVDILLSNKPESSSLLKKALDEVVGDYDYIVIDCGPTLGLPTMNALMSSDYCIIPTLSDYLSLVSIKDTRKTISVAEAANERLVCLGPVLTMLDKREAISDDSKELLTRMFKDNTFNTFIQTNVKFKVIPAERKSIFEAASKSNKGVKNYEDFTNEVLEKIKTHELSKSLNISKVSRQDVIQEGRC